jgi:hypothetical protein
MATTNDNETSPLGFDPVEVAAAAMVPDPDAATDEHDTVVTPRPEPAAPVFADDVLPADGGRRARREATTAQRLPLTTPSPLGRLVIPIALVLIAAIGLLAAWTHYQSSDDPNAGGGPAVPSGAVTIPGDGATAVPSTSPSAITSPTASTLPSASATTTASATGGAVPTASASHSPSTSPSSSASTDRPIDRKVPVVVLNATGRPGLAAKVAAQLRAKGWNVTSVGNWTRGGIAKTTIYLNGHLDAQATIRKDFRYATGPILLPLASMPHLRMIVVVGDDYPR